MVDSAFKFPITFTVNSNTVKENARKYMQTRVCPQNMY